VVLGWKVSGFLARLVSALCGAVACERQASLRRSVRRQAGPAPTVPFLIWAWGAAAAWARSIMSPRQFPDLLPGRPAQCGVMAPGRRQFADPTAYVTMLSEFQAEDGEGQRGECC